MRFMMLVRSDAETEAGGLPGAELIAAMGRYNEELVRAGVLLAGEGLRPSSSGARVRFAGRERRVVEGPFDPGELIAGFWLIQAKSKAEALEWVKRIPNPDGAEFEIELRQVHEADDEGGHER